MVLLLQEFDLHIIDRKGAENPVADNLSRLENVLDDPLPIDDSFPDEQLAVINASHSAPWYADYANYIVAKFIPPSFTYQQKKKFFYDLWHYFWDDPHLYKEGVDGVIRWCVPEHEQEQILHKCHSEAYGGHHARDYAVGAVLGQGVDKKLNVIQYASKTLDNAQRNYATTEKEFLAVVFACDKFRPYIVDSKVTIHTDHAAIKISYGKERC